MIKLNIVIICKKIVMGAGFQEIRLAIRDTLEPYVNLVISMVFKENNIV